MIEEEYKEFDAEIQKIAENEIEKIEKEVEKVEKEAEKIGEEIENSLKKKV